MSIIEDKNVVRGFYPLTMTKLGLKGDQNLFHETLQKNRAIA